jgi:DNA polymerase V
MFPSPAENYLERGCDLNDLLTPNREAAYFVRVDTDSMVNDNIHKGDILIVDRSALALSGSIVFVWLNGEHYVKRIQYVEELTVLMSANENYEPVYVHPGENYKLFGVVTYVIKKARTHVRPD